MLTVDGGVGYESAAHGVGTGALRILAIDGVDTVVDNEHVTLEMEFITEKMAISWDKVDFTLSVPTLAGLSLRGCSKQHHNQMLAHHKEVRKKLKPALERAKEKILQVCASAPVR